MLYYRENSIKDLVSKLSNNLYLKDDLLKKLKNYNHKIQQLFEPLVIEVYRLRELPNERRELPSERLNTMAYSSSQRSLYSTKSASRT